MERAGDDVAESSKPPKSSNKDSAETESAKEANRKGDP